MNKLNLRQYQLIVDGLYNNLVLNLDYINDLEKSGKNPIWTKGYVYHETTDLIHLFKLQLKKKFKNDETIETYDNLITKLKSKYEI